jgi:hypothetical protein
VATWDEFETAAPELAAAGRRLLTAFTLAFIGTLRPDGAPRVHPMTITLFDGGLYVFPVASTPKARDLERDSRYALHSFPHFREGTLATYTDEEFTCAGTAARIGDARLRDLVRAAHNDSVGAHDKLWRLDLDRAHHRTRVEGRSVYTRWSEHRPGAAV